MTDNYANILIIDDHAMFRKSLKDYILDISAQESIKIKITEVKDGAQAMEILKTPTDSSPFDLIFLDIKLPPSLEHNIVTGEDIGFFIRNTYPKTNLVIITMYNDLFRVGSLIKQLDPHSLLVKSDLDPENFYSQISKILKGEQQFGESAQKAMKSFAHNYPNFDEFDRRLLYELASGANLNEIAEVVPLSRSALAKRKTQLRIKLDVGPNDNRKLIEKARDLGLI